MSSSQYLLSAAIIVFVLWSGLGTHPLTRASFIRPLVIVAFVAGIYLRAVPTAGNDLQLELIGALAGAGFGILAAFVQRIRREGDQILVTGGIAYAILWIFVIGGRTLFAYGADHWYPEAIVRFSMTHGITSSQAWVAGFVMMALAMVIARVATTAIRASRATVPALAGTMAG